MQKSTSGFTIVELIVIVVVIGIIAAIAIVSYGSYQTTIANDQRAAELRGWRTSYEKYWSANGEYPYPAEDGIYCLGTGFPDGRCSIFTSSPYTNASEAGSANLMSMLAPFDPPPAGPREQIENSGTTPPYVEYLSGYMYLRTILEFPGDEDRQCPSDMDRFSTATSTSGGVTKTRITCQFVLSNW